jgi:hypothetical protein
MLICDFNSVNFSVSLCVLCGEKEIQNHGGHRVHRDGTEEFDLKGNKYIVNKIWPIVFVEILSCKSKSENNNVIFETDSSHMVESVSQELEDNQQQKEDVFRPLRELDYGRVEVELEDTTQFYQLKGECAVMFMPDTAWIKKQQEKYPDAWDEIVSDKQYYESLATDTLKLKGIKVYYGLSWNRRYFQFQKRDKSNYTLDANKMKDSWGIILFNGQDDPVIWSSTFLGDALRTVYKK